MSIIINSKYNSMPQQVAQNEKDIKELKATIEGSKTYSYEGVIAIDATSVPVANVFNMPTGTNTGYIIDTDANYFEIVANTNDTLYIHYVATIKGQQGVKGDTGEQGSPGVSVTDVQFMNTEGTLYDVMTTLSNGNTIKSGIVDVPKGEVGTSIEEIQTGVPTVNGEYTHTPVNVVLTDGTTQNFELPAKNGENGASVTDVEFSPVASEDPTQTIYKATTTLSDGTTHDSGDIVLPKSNASVTIHNLNIIYTNPANDGRITLTIVNDNKNSLTYNDINGYLGYMATPLAACGWYEKNQSRMVVYNIENGPNIKITVFNDDRYESIEIPNDEYMTVTDVMLTINM